MTVAPLIWLLVFDLVVGLIWWALGHFGITLHPRLEQVMIFLVILINLVVVIVWLMSFLGWGPAHLYEGPFRR